MFGRVEKGEERNWRDLGEEKGIYGCLVVRKFVRKKVANPRGQIWKEKGRENFDETNSMSNGI